MKLLFKHATAALLAALLALPAFGQKISADPTAATLGGGEYLAGVQTGANVKILPSQIFAYTLANIHTVNAQSGTSYTYLSSDRGKLVTHTNASTISAGLSQATGSFGSGWFMLVQNRGAGTLTITPTTSTIDGASTLVLTAGQGAFVVSDGTNWYTMKSSGGASVAGLNTQVQYNNSGSFGAEAAFTYDAATDLLSVPNVTTTGLVSTAASATGGAGFRMPHGAAPTSPTNGDVWTTTAGLYARINGATVGPFGAAAAAGSTTQVQYNNAGSFGGEAAFAYDASTDLLSVVNITTTGRILTAASATGGSGFRAPHGAAPTSPTNGDIWTTTSGLFARINGSTVGPFVASASVTGFTSSLNTASPNNTTNASRLLASGGTTDQDIVLQPKAAGGILAQLPDGTTAGGDKRGSSVVDFQQSRSSSAQVAGGFYTVIGGGQGNTTSGSASVVSGGNGNTASASNATVSGGTTNTASGTESNVAGGGSNVASTGYAAIGGGVGNTASGSVSAISGGSTNTASGAYATVSGGATNTASGDYSHASGYLATTRGLHGAQAWSSGGLFDVLGVNQAGRYMAKIRTSNATPVVATFDAATASATNSIVLPNESVYAFKATISARNQSANEGAGYTIEGVVMRDTSAGTIAFIGTPTVVVLGESAGLSACTVAAQVNTTLGSLEILLTGDASDQVRWTVVVHTVETTE